MTVQDQVQDYEITHLGEQLLRGGIEGVSYTNPLVPRADGFCIGGVATNPLEPTIRT